MKKYSFLITLLLLPVCAFAQSSQAQNAIEQLLSARSSFSYTYKVTGKTSLSGDGSALLQGNCYCLKGNGLEVFCDGATRWTMDRNAKEVYIENASDTSDILSNPAKLLSSLSDVRTVGSTISGSYLAADGSRISFTASGIKRMERTEDQSEFVLDTGKLGNDFVITDLR